jgi:hypothetical protein
MDNQETREEKIEEKREEKIEEKREEKRERGKIGCAPSGVWKRFVGGKAIDLPMFSLVLEARSDSVLSEVKRQGWVDLAATTVPGDDRSPAYVCNIPGTAVVRQTDSFGLPVHTWKERESWTSHPHRPVGTAVVTPRHPSTYVVSVVVIPRLRKDEINEGTQETFRAYRAYQATHSVLSAVREFNEKSGSARKIHTVVIPCMCDEKTYVGMTTRTSIEQMMTAHVEFLSGEGSMLDHPPPPLFYCVNGVDVAPQEVQKV